MTNPAVLSKEDQLELIPEGRIEVLPVAAALAARAAFGARTNLRIFVT